MIGWAYAGAALVGILVYEAVLFRYFAPRLRGSGGSDAAVTGRGRDRGDESAGVEGAADGGAAVVCGDCGTENVRAPGVVFCRECQSRIG